MNRRQAIFSAFSSLCVAILGNPLKLLGSRRTGLVPESEFYGGGKKQWWHSRLCIIKHVEILHDITTVHYWHELLEPPVLAVRCPKRVEITLLTPTLKELNEMRPGGCGTFLGCDGVLARNLTRQDVEGLEFVDVWIRSPDDNSMIQETPAPIPVKYIFETAQEKKDRENSEAQARAKLWDFSDVSVFERHKIHA